MNNIKQHLAVSQATARDKLRYGAALPRVMKLVRDGCRGHIRKVVFCCLCCFPFLSALAAPRLAVPPEGVAFGEIAAGEAASKSIGLRNVSSSPVSVSQVKGCCGADATLSSMRIEPSSSATLSVSLKPMLPGEFSKHVRILCDDPESPVINIPVTGTAVESRSARAASHWTLPAVVLALVSREPGAWRSFALLALYNLAFVFPLVAVFVLASKTTDAFQMAKWSSCNVIPAKIALGLVFALLGIIILVTTVHFR